MLDSCGGEEVSSCGGECWIAVVERGVGSCGREGVGSCGGEGWAAIVERGWVAVAGRVG